MHSAFLRISDGTLPGHSLVFEGSIRKLYAELILAACNLRLYPEGSSS